MRGAVQEHRPGALAALFERFDRVYCLSLPGCDERRAWVERHLAERGCGGFEYFAATGRDDPAVARFYASGRVARYPTCFRCGALSCGDDSCNNVLIEPQVATFITYLRLWRRIVDQGIGRALVFEDDVRFSSDADATVDWLLRDGLLDDGRFVAGTPALLRLGWARCGEHDSGLAPALRTDAPRMANPLHALTGAFAERLLNRFERCETTVDIYQHERQAADCTAFTLFPPLADELSWSEGALDSLIHPKQKRVEYLEREMPDDAARIAAARAARQAHRDHVDFRLLTIAAAAACDRATIARALGALGLELGCGTVERDGVISGEGRAGGTAPGETYFSLRVLALCDPRTAIAALAAEPQSDPAAYQRRREAVRTAAGLDLDECTPLDAAAIGWVASNAIAESYGIDFRWRLEAGIAPLLERLERTPAANADLTLPRPVPAAGDADLVAALRGDVVAAVNEQCERYGYRPLET